MGNISVKALKDNYRNDFVKALASKLGDDVGYVASNELNMPIVLPNGDESWITVKVSIPAGSRETGEAYDGYAARADYAAECREREIKRQKAADAKARKIEAQAKAKAEKQAKKQRESE